MVLTCKLRGSLGLSWFWEAATWEILCRSFKPSAATRLSSDFFSNYDEIFRSYESHSLKEVLFCPKSHKRMFSTVILKNRDFFYGYDEIFYGGNGILREICAHSI